MIGLSGSEEYLRGHSTVSMLVVDEAARMDDGDGEEWLRILAPSTECPRKAWRRVTNDNR